MAVTSRPPRHARRFSPVWSRLHFLLRFLGLTGVLVASVGLLLAEQDNALTSWQQAYDVGRAALEGQPAAVTTYLVLGGAAAALLALLFEILGVLRFAAGRRSVVGFNATVQVALAAALLVAVNYYAFFNSIRFDWTRAREFTLPVDIREKLAQLDRATPTTIVVYQRHKSLGSLSDKPDRYDYAAERQVVEKVKDLVEQLRAVGPQFRVEVLDVEDEKFEDKLNALSEEAPALRKAIDTTPENCLFFYAKSATQPAGRVQRLSFNDFYLLDKATSEEGRGNLVLRYQGMEPFARRVFSLEERAPKVAIAVIHEVLTTTGNDDMGLRGLRKALTDRGIEVKDILLKKWSRFAPPEAGAYSPDENALAQFEERETLLGLNIATLERSLKEMEKQIAPWRKALSDEATRKELTKAYARQLRGRVITKEMVEAQLPVFEEDMQDLKQAIENYRQRLAATTEEKQKLNVSALSESKRMTDTKARLARFLADCDLLILPRMTLRNTASDFDNIPARLYRADDAQADAIKDYLTAGKPVLACFGPTNAPNDEQRQPGDNDNKPEPLEELFGALGIRFGKQTILFDDEAEAFADRRSGVEFAGTTAEVPPLLLDWRVGTGHPLGTPQPPEKPNPIRESLRLTSRSLGRDSQGKERALELRLRHPRPIYYSAPDGVTPPFDPDFLLTSGRSWNEDQPFPTSERVPQYERAKPRDGEKPAVETSDPLEARRRGPFPIGVAIEAKLPEAWKPASSTARLAVIGQGGFFAGKELPPSQETLMLDTVNWLLGRDDYLPQEGTSWSFPRVALDEEEHGRERQLWLWGARVGLPVLFAYLGIVVLLIRRLR